MSAGGVHRLDTHVHQFVGRYLGRGTGQEDVERSLTQRRILPSIHSVQRVQDSHMAPQRQSRPDSSR